MKKVLYVAPFESNGRYKGGIMSIANAVFTKLSMFEKEDVELVKFNMNFKKRNNFSVGKFKFENIIHFFRTAKKLTKDVKKNSCDVIYYNTSKALGIVKDAVVVRVFRLFNKKTKIILHIHFAEYKKIMPAKKWLEKFLLKTFIKKVDSIVFLSANTKDEFVEKGMNEEKCFVLYNFHNFDVPQEVIEEKIEKFENKTHLDILFMGTIDKRKGIIDLLDALKKCTVNYKLHLCGICNDDSIKDEFDKKIACFKDNVILHGYIENEQKEEILKKSDLMILPTYGEGFPVVLVEGMAFGCSISTTLVGAIPEFISCDKNGYLYDPGDIESITNTIESAFSNKEKTISQMKNNFEESFYFNLNEFVKKTIEVIKRV